MTNVDEAVGKPTSILLANCLFSEHTFDKQYTSGFEAAPKS